MILKIPPRPQDSPDDFQSEDIAELAKLFKLLGDETRLRIVVHISQQGSVNVSELQELLGMSQPLVSHHLATLRAAKILDSQRRGKEMHYSVCPGRFESLMDMLVDRKQTFRPCDRFLECVLGS